MISRRPSAIELRLAVGVVVVLLACSGALLLGLALGAVTLPLVRLPPVSGPDAVGTVALALNISRATGSGRHSGGRFVTVQLWYPAKTDHREPQASYRFASPAAGSIRERISRALVVTNAYVAPIVAPGRHPVLLYIPSWGGRRGDGTAQAEDLASQGFIVVAMDDLYPTEPMDFTSEAAFQHTMRWAGEKVRLEAEAVSGLLRALGRLDHAGPSGSFNDRLNLQRIGAYGFSFGGAVAAEAAWHDPRIRAAVDLDGWLFGDAAARGVAQPFLIVSSAPDAHSAQPPQAMSDAERRYTTKLNQIDEKQIDGGFRRYGGYFLTIAGADHFDFCDVAVLPSIRHRGVGSIGGARAERIISAYLGQFFGRYVDEKTGPLLTAGVDIDPDARLTVRPRSQLRARR